MAIEFEEGRPYFVTGFFDDKLELPSIATYIYLGPDPFDDGTSGATYYFQDAESYARYGDLARNSSSDGVAEFIELDEDELHIVVDQKGLAEWILKNHSLGSPK